MDILTNVFPPLHLLPILYLKAMDHFTRLTPELCNWNKSISMDIEINERMEWPNLSSSIPRGRGQQPLWWDSLSAWRNLLAGQPSLTTEPSSVIGDCRCILKNNLGQGLRPSTLLAFPGARFRNLPSYPTRTPRSPFLHQEILIPALFNNKIQVYSVLDLPDNKLLENWSALRLSSPGRICGLERKLRNKVDIVLVSWRKKEGKKTNPEQLFLPPPPPPSLYLPAVGEK